jgi:hypothetical protein
LLPWPAEFSGSELASPMAAFATLLAAATTVAGSVLPGARVRLLRLSTVLIGLASDLTAISQMIAILDHELATHAACLASILFHRRLLSPQPCLHRQTNVHEDRLRAMPTLRQGHNSLYIRLRVAIGLFSKIFKATLRVPS